MLPPILRTLYFSGNSSYPVRPPAFISISQQRLMSGLITLMCADVRTKALIFSLVKPINPPDITAGHGWKNVS